MKALKKVPGKNKGLSKLPTAVRNKMGYMKKGGKVYQGGGKAPKGEINLGKGSYKGMTLSDAEELNRRVGENYGKHASDIRTGYKGLDDHMDDMDSDKRQAFARAGGKYYDGDGGAAGRRKKAYADRLEARTDLKIRMEKYDAKTKAEQAEDRKKAMKAVDTYNKSTAKMKKGGKVVKYQKGGTVLPEVTVVGKKGKGLKERTVVGRGNSGADYLQRRKELTAELTDAFYTKNNRYPGGKMTALEKELIADKVRVALRKEGMTEQGVTSKATGKRLSPEMEEQYRERTNRR
tara:strand:- start:731 stop:1603 length:873 start_codon:yes stop_codon:yes gene_type:complete